MKKLSVAHLDTEMSWRGGQKQELELIRRLILLNIKNVLVCKPLSELSKRAQHEGIMVIHLPLAGEWDVLSALKLRAYIIREQINIVHVHSSHAHAIALMAVLRLTSCKLVVSRRVDFHIESFFSRKFKYGSSVNKIIAVSEAIKRILVEDGIDFERIETIRSGIVTNEFEKSDQSRNLRAELGLSQHNIVIATVAALAPHKAHHVLLKAAYIVVKKHPEVIFLLAGEGEMRSVIEKNIYNLGLEKFVKLLGFIDDIGAVYRAADIFALSSSEEGLCTSILDAMFFNLPIVATNAGGIPELIQDGVNGLIVPVNDYISFAERINILIENPTRRKTMGTRSSDILEQNKIEHTIEKTLHVYEKLWE